MKKLKVCSNPNCGFHWQGDGEVWNEPCPSCAEVIELQQEMTVKQLQTNITELLVEKGFMSKMNNIRLLAGNDQLSYYLGALLATEPAEYIDAVKKGKGVEAELEEAADTIIRAMNIFIVNEADAESVIRAKMEKNMGRPFVYGHGEGE